MRGNSHVRFGPGAVGKGSAQQAPRRRPTGALKGDEQDFKEGAVRLVRETGKPIAQVARELGIHDATLGNWVNAERRRRGEGNSGLGEDERAELVRLRRENAELRMRCDVLKRSMALWVTDAVGGR